MKHFIWWLTQADYVKQKTNKRPSKIPKNIWNEVESRSGRGGRFRLWVPKGISYVGMPSDIPNDHWEEFKSRTDDAGGIVITEEHIDNCLNWGGMVTTDRLEQVFPSKNPTVRTCVKKSTKKDVLFDLQWAYNRLDHLMTVAAEGDWNDSGASGPMETIKEVNSVLPMLMERYGFKKTWPNGRKCKPEYEII